jgi:hypothetical protein
VSRKQKRRYGFAAGLVVVGFACAAVSTGTIGGALATVFLAAGLLLFLVFLFGDLGLTVDSKPRRRAPAPGPPSGSAPEPSPAHTPSPAQTPSPEPADPPHNAAGGRPRATVRRPERLRGDRRRPS